LSKNGSNLEERYKKESDPMVKERLLLILKIKYDNMIPSQVGRELRRGRSWASKWWRRYIQEGANGLNDKPRSGRPSSKLPEEIAFQLRKELLESKQGWSTKQVNDMMVRRGGGVGYHYAQFCRLLHRRGLKQKVPRKIHINTASEKEKDAFKKTVRKS
jgi:transposase